MFFSYSITLPANGSPSSRTRTMVTYSPGVVKGVFVIIPGGSADLVRLHILKAVHKLWPHNEEGYFRGNAASYEIPENLELLEPPHELIIEGWNTDDTYEHTPLVFLAIEPAPPKPELTWAEWIKSRLGLQTPDSRLQTPASPGGEVG